MSLLEVDCVDIWKRKCNDHGWLPPLYQTPYSKDDIIDVSILLNRRPPLFSAHLIIKTSKWYKPSTWKYAEFSMYRRFKLSSNIRNKRLILFSIKQGWCQDPNEVWDWGD